VKRLYWVMKVYSILLLRHAGGRDAPPLGQGGGRAQYALELSRPCDCG
jgi:hypothetical protein